MSWVGFERDGVAFRGWDGGSGAAIVFQHGLGGDEAQVAENLPDIAGFRRLTLECRAQGSSGVGDPLQFGIGTFAEDVLAFATARGAYRFVVGGISMGAAIALRLAIREPQRVAALILARPAWLFDAAPSNMEAIAAVAAFLKRPDPVAAQAAFSDTPVARRFAKEAPDNLATLLGHFNSKDRPTRAALLATIAADGPGVTEDQVRALCMPTLVIGHEIDAIHPRAMAERLAATIPGAQLALITPKAIDKARHVAEFRDTVRRFIATLPFSQGSVP
jgi:pimeloyl-ACP methyl ester carboxylesterase